MNTSKDRFPETEGWACSAAQERDATGPTGKTAQVKDNVMALCRTREALALKGKSLLSWFSDLERGEVRLGVAGKIMSANDVIECLGGGADFVLIGRGAILAHDFPLKVAATSNYHSPNLPVSSTYLRHEGLGDAFVDYMRGFPGFVSNDCAAPSSRTVK